MSAEGEGRRDVQVLSLTGKAPAQPTGRVERCAHPPARTTILYDGHCRFCVRSSALLVRLSGGQLDPLSFREEGVLARFAPLGFAQCERAMQLIRPDGRIFEGLSAAVEALSGRWFGPLARAYYLPGIRQASDRLYALVAKYRFRLAGTECDSGTCRLH